MCRSIAEGGRRCPHDTAAARRKRWNNQKLRERAQGVTLQEPRIAPDVPVEDLPPDPRAQFQVARERLTGLLAASPPDPNWDKDVTVAVVEMGEAVQALAVANGLEPADEVVAAIKELDTRRQAEIRQREDDNVQWWHELEEHKAKYGTARAFYDAEPEEYARLRDQINTSYADTQGLVEDYKKERAALLDGYVTVRADHYRRALEDVGVTFHDPKRDAPLVTHRTTRKAANLMGSVLPLAPQAWVEASNEAAKDRPLRVWESKRRSHYQDEKRSQRSRTVAATSVVTAGGSVFGLGGEAEDWEPTSTLEMLEYTKTPPDNAPESIKNRVLDKDEWFYTPYERKMLYGGQLPRGRGWVEVADHSDGWHTYARPATRKQTVETIAEAEITVPPTDKGQYARSVAIHEFTHRAEKVVADLPEMERAFLRTRAAGEIPTWLGKGYDRHEVATADNFPSPYMGKHYDNPKSTEIGSMGMEALFFGRHGAFIGEQADPEYEAFMLGVLAQTGAPK